MSLRPLLEKDAKYKKHNIIERICEPERQIIDFLVAWNDHKGMCRSTRATGSSSTRRWARYKGGLRFHPSVTRGHRSSSWASSRSSRTR